MGRLASSTAGQSAPSAHPSRGEIWFGNLDPVVGHEQSGDRPLLVVSRDAYNSLPRQLLVVAPLTRTVRGDAFEVPILPPEGNLTAASVVLCDQVRNISRGRLRRKLGKIEPATLDKVDKLIHRMFGPELLQTGVGRPQNTWAASRGTTQPGPGCSSPSRASATGCGRSTAVRPAPVGKGPARRSRPWRRRHDVLTIL